MDEGEFRRRIEVYLERELPDLVGERAGIAEAVARRVWPLVNEWQAEQASSGELLMWIAKRVHEEAPELASRLSVEQTGSETGFLAAGRVAHRTAVPSGVRHDGGVRNRIIEGDDYSVLPVPMVQILRALRRGFRRRGPGADEQVGVHGVRDEAHPGSGEPDADDHA
jgi:hypothetical protein